jgi:hypothetical protein
VLSAGLLVSACAPAVQGTSVDPPSVQASGIWSRLPVSPLAARREAIGEWLGDRFVVVGGWTGPPCPPSADCIPSEFPALRDGASFDPRTGEWRRIAKAPIPVSGWNSAVAGGFLYLLTGEEWRTDSPAAVLRYDPAADEWVRFPAPAGEANSLVAVGGHLLAISSSDEFGPAADWLLDPDSGEWTALPDDPLGPSFDREATDLDGALILSARDLVPSPGSEEPSLARMARLSADLREWTMLPDSEAIGGGPTAASGLIVFPFTGSADGGEVNNWGRDYFFGGIYDPADGSWRDLPVPPPEGGLPEAALTLGDRVLVGGHLLDPAAWAWTVLPAMPGGERASETIVAGDETILVWGGSTLTDNLADGYLLRL